MGEKLRCMTSIFLRRNNQILMLYKQGGRVVSNVWVASAGGHFEEKELNNPEACVLRELQEELVEHWTYPLIQPKLLEEIVRREKR